MAKKKEETKEVIESKGTAVAVSNDDTPDYIKKDVARGSEDVGMEDLSIPRLDIVQALSPCRKKNDSAFIEGAEEGMMFNNVTRELFTSSVLIVPIMFKKEFIIWKDRKAGGGFRGSFQSKEDAEVELTSIIKDGDNGPFDIVDTAQHLCLLVRMKDNQCVSTEEIAISMSKSKMKVSRQWNSMVRLYGGDRFSRMYEVSAVEDSSEKGEYYNFSVKPVGFAPKEAYLKAEEIYESIASGERVIKVNTDVDEPEVNASEEKEF